MGWTPTNAASLSLFGGIAGIGGNMLSNFLTNEQNQNLNNINRQHELYLLGLQNQFSQQAAEDADRRTRALYSDLQSPEALRLQLEKAGLSVGMMYGMNGIGGSMQSGAQAATPNAQNRGTIPMNPILNGETAMMMANAAKMAAETENIKQDTKKKEADTESAWQDIPLKQKQCIVMDHTIQEIDQNIAESMQKVENMVEEKANLLAERGNIEAEKELRQAQKEYTESLKALSDIDALTRNEINQATLDNIKAQTRQANAAAKKLNIETETIKQQRDWITNKLINEWLLSQMELNEIKPAELWNIRAKTADIIAGKMSKEQRNEFFNKFKNPEKARVFWEDAMPMIMNFGATAIGAAAHGGF